MGPFKRGGKSAKRSGFDSVRVHDGDENPGEGKPNFPANKRVVRQKLDPNHFGVEWYCKDEYLTSLLGHVHVTHYLKVAVDPYLTHVVKVDGPSSGPIEFVIPIINSTGRKELAKHCDASEAPSFDALRTCLAKIASLKDTVLVLKKGNNASSSQTYLNDHSSYRLSVHAPSDSAEASSSSTPKPETIELMISPSCRRKIPVVDSKVIVNPADTSSTISLFSVFDGDVVDGKKSSDLYTYLSSRLDRRVMSAADQAILYAEKCLAAAAAARGGT